jgi:hypothetical protein
MLLKLTWYGLDRSLLELFVELDVCVVVVTDEVSKAEVDFDRPSELESGVQ